MNNWSGVEPRYGVPKFYVTIVRSLLLSEVGRKDRSSGGATNCKPAFYAPSTVGSFDLKKHRGGRLVIVKPHPQFESINLFIKGLSINHEIR
jgi:hypothetical protein